jgi:hypothetical protein
VYYRQLFPHNYDCIPYPIVVGCHSVAVLFLQTQIHVRWLIHSVFSPKYPKIQPWGGHRINIYFMVVG